MTANKSIHLALIINNSVTNIITFFELAYEIIMSHSGPYCLGSDSTPSLVNEWNGLPQRDGD